MGDDEKEFSTRVAEFIAVVLVAIGFVLALIGFAVVIGKLWDLL